MFSMGAVAWNLLALALTTAIDLRALCSGSDVRSWHECEHRCGAKRVRCAPPLQMSTCSAIASASSTSIPNYLTVLSIFVWPRSSCTARKLPVRR
jgi:hypothetical protein